MKYFFVFQNKSYEEEYKGGYLWAPQYGKNGRHVSHWDKMKSVKQGDIIIHSYLKEIKSISIAKNDVYSAQRPSELSHEWEAEGWRVDCEYIPFARTIITSDYMDVLLKLQPKKDAPFNRVGRGNTGYLFEANKEMFEFIVEKISLVQKSDEEKERVQKLLEFNLQEKKSLTNLEIEMEIESTKAKQLSIKTLAKHLENSVKEVKIQKTESTVYYRSSYLKEMVKRIADGKCQYCGSEAPFLDKNNEPYLEEHHVKKLADGGTDTIDNVVAICPNCHRKMHVLEDEKDVVILQEIAKQNEKTMARMLAYTKQIGNKSNENN